MAKWVRLTSEGDGPLKVLAILRSTVALMRCHQWIKNVFVFAAPLFAKELGEAGQLATTCITFLAFCLVSSSVYVLNDLADLERDRAHPRKRLRPLASGQLTIPYGLFLMVALLAMGTGLALVLVSWETAAVLVAYAASNVFYSFILKSVVILDVGFIAVGFILRILAGAFATATQPSYWLLLCTLNVALFLGFAKRRAEVMTLGDKAEAHREVLAHYSEGFLDQMISIVTTSTLVCYILYTVDDKTIAYFGTHGLVFTVPFVMYGIFRYLYLTYHLQEGASPTRTVLMDPYFLLNNALWGISCVAIIYWGEQFPWTW